MRKALAVLAALSLLSGCTASLRTGTKGGGPSARVALLLPERKASRYEAGDQPYFAQKLSELCPGCTVDYRNAEQNADTQLQQAKDALDQGAKVLVLTPVDSVAAGAIVTEARGRGVPVISYDRLVLKTQVDYYISFDNAKVGALQAAALLQALGAKASQGEILWINGSPTDNNATLFKQGAHAGLDGKVKVAAESDTAEWNPDNAKAWTARVLPTLRGRTIVGVYAANDGTAGQVPSILLDPVAVTKDTIAATVVKDGFVTPGALCAGAYADACHAAGIA